MINLEIIKQLYGKNTIVYGPYTRKDGRKHCVLFGVNEVNNLTVSYPKLIMECHFKRRLSNDETVDHIDENHTDDSIDNLQILTRVENAIKSASKATYIECANCNKLFKKKYKTQKLCSNKCRYIKHVGCNQYSK